MHGAKLVRSLHWLPAIADRIKFKLATLTFKVLNTHQPAYLNVLISQRQSSRTLRSSSDYLSLNEPRTRTAFGDGAFSAALPKIWNAIPLSIRDSPSVDVFKRRLKTRYFDSRQSSTYRPPCDCPRFRFSYIADTVRVNKYVTLHMSTVSYPSRARPIKWG